MDDNLSMAAQIIYTGTIFRTGWQLRITEILPQYAIKDTITYAIWCYTGACIIAPKLPRTTGTDTVYLICPPWADEVNCIRTSCPRQFKCHNTSTCIAPDNMCNGVYDCILGDDEYFCYPKLPACPENCTCIVYSIACVRSINPK